LEKVKKYFSNSKNKKQVTSSSYRIKEKTGITFNKGLVLRYEKERYRFNKDSLSLSFKFNSLCPVTLA